MSIPKYFHQVAPIGDGHFCVVSRYRSSKDGYEYAVKKLKKEHIANEDYRVRFLREVSILTELNGHDHIINLVESEPDPKELHLWYVMPLASHNLYNYIKRHHTTLDRSFKISIFEHVISAITYAHSLNLLHRDITPNNILLFESDEGITAKLSDFGLGKDTEAIRYTRTSASGYGQILYVAPEQLEHLKNADIRSDIYSLGKVLYFVMTGKDPGEIKTCDFVSLIRKATQERPTDRHQTIDEFAAEFEAMRKFFQDTAIPIDQQTMRGYLEGRADVDWKEFHEIAVLGTSDNHPYFDYVWPTVEYFSDQKRLVAYYATKKGELLHFVNTFIQGIAAIRRNLGWNFKTLDDIGNLVYRIYLLAKERDIKLLCICTIWEIAYDDNQFALQRSFHSIINNNLLPADVEGDFAAYIVSSNTRRLQMSLFQGVRLPANVRRAILQISDN